MIVPKQVRLLMLACGLLALSMASAQTRYVWPASPHPAPPYDSWSNAAHVIQDAVDAAQAGDVVLVTNGIYSTGGRTVNGGTVTNRVALDKAVRVESVQGPAVTLITGAPGQSGYNNGHGVNAARPAYVGEGAQLIGFTLSGGHTEVGGSEEDQSGGGALCEPTGIVTNCWLVDNAAFKFGGGARGGILKNCVLSGNIAGYGGGTYLSMLVDCMLRDNVASYGGGAAGGVLSRCILTGNAALGVFGGGGVWAAGLDNCLLLGNTSQTYGGGSTGGSLTNCTLVENAALLRGGGAYDATLVNCILYRNTAPLGSNHLYSTLDFCCTTPLPDGGTANIADEPEFMNENARDYRLRFGSPCIDSGLDFEGLRFDLQGAPRVVDGDCNGVAFADIGAYEYDGRVVDSDGDGATDFQETVMDTNPTDPASCLRIRTIRWGVPVQLQFSSSSNRLYTLRSSPALIDPVWSIVPGNVDLPGNGGLQTSFDESTEGMRYYRIEVRAPDGLLHIGDR